MNLSTDTRRRLITAVTAKLWTVDADVVVAAAVFLGYAIDEIEAFERRYGHD